jgi:hypothetical protein
MGWKLGQDSLLFVLLHLFRLYQKFVDFFGLAHILQNEFGRRVFGFQILSAAVYGPKKYVDKN